MNHHNFLYLRTPLNSLDQTFNGNADSVSEVFKEGLYLASPDYYNQFDKNTILSNKEREKLKNSFNKYWQRSCTRCTPYGTFAGSAVVNLDSNSTEIILDNIYNHNRIVRLDMNFLVIIIKYIEKIPAVKDQLLFYKNNSIFGTPGSYRYVESSFFNNNRKYKLVSVDKDLFLSKALDLASSGITLINLSKIIAEFSDVSFNEAYEFVNDLWNSQLLISELEPCVTGKDQFKTLVDKLLSLEDIPIDLNKLSKIAGEIANVKTIKDYRNIENELKSLFDISVPKNSIQVDLIKTLKKSNIQKSIIKTIFKQLNELFVFSRKNESENLKNFKSKFFEKFDEREIPLLFALDMEFGVGYSNNGSESVGGDEWIEDLGVLYYKESNSVNIDFIQKFSFNKYLDFIRNGQENIEIKEKDLLNYSNELKNMFPHSMYLYGEFLKLNNEFDDENFSFVFKGFGGPSGANLLGRFTYGDTKLEGLTNNIIEDEENASPDVLFAEIVHLPEDRLGNVLLRPVLRKFEIPYLGKSGNEFKNQILVEDLMVSIKNNEIILRSKRLNKRIIPRLTTAHNFNSFNNLPIYKFLCELQFQNYASPIIWDWGILNSQKYLPRVFYKNIIIKKAVWKINIVDFKDELSESLFSSNYIASKLNTIGIPKIFTIVQGDNKLLVNIDIEDNIILFKNILERNKNIIIEEFLFNEDNCIVHDIEGRPYVNEVIIPFKNKVNAIHSYAFNDNIINESERKFAPGDGWLYFKIYCGSKIAEEILNEVLYEFITQSSENNLFDLFFFIRYKDPNPHLRLRFKSKNKKKLDKIKTEINKLIKPYLINGYIDSINLDTYVRELERYDDKLIFEAERIFHNDSLAVLHILKALKNDQTINNRIYCALIGVDTLLDNFGFSLYEKKLLLEKLSNRMLKRFGGHKKIRKIINDKYRSNQNVIFDLFQNKEKFKEFYRIMDLRSILNIEVIESLKNKIRKEEYSSKIENLISSYLHMFINRIFISQQLKYELLIYTFLERFYSSKFAVSNKEKIKK